MAISAGFIALALSKYAIILSLLLNVVWRTPMKNVSLTRTPRIRVKSYVTTDNQLASVSWNKAPIWGLRPDFYYCQQLRVCWCGALYLTRRWVCPLELLLALASAVILVSKSGGTRDHISPSQIRDFPFRRLPRLAGSTDGLEKCVKRSGLDIIEALTWRYGRSYLNSCLMFLKHMTP
jgi:hypothetical protein